MVNVRGIEPSGGALQSTPQGTAQGKQNQWVIERTEAKKSEKDGLTGAENDGTSPFFFIHRSCATVHSFFALARVISAP